MHDSMYDGSPNEALRDAKERMKCDCHPAEPASMASVQPYVPRQVALHQPRAAEMHEGEKVDC